ncbi:MAG: 1-deoxy-D-xylulose-5-phosphate reductoisomerase [Azoarcus sp.]|jgi:1-deoxy-D-xylulose-5-phosphate reductoisomerase|nr:1-deoxy-D-xylulose-5-phosphate reductoisomerase [Azoarcus sp.]
MSTASVAHTPQNVTLLGATGSIGANTLDVLARHPDRYSVFALTAHRATARLADLCLRYSPRYAVMADQDAAKELKRLLREGHCSTTVLAGHQALCDVARDAEVDVVLAAIVGAAGLKPTMAAVLAGKKVLLANKEALVMTGQIFMDAVETSGCCLMPIDSEHNAIFQSLYRSDQRVEMAGVRRVLLTASGGPFRHMPVERLETVTPDEACIHPVWSMGRKISVDSATLMNKGLEVIEARWLFNVSPEQIEVVIHPQGIVHSMVDYVDGSVIAQLGNPDMRIPIAHALAWPERMVSGASALDLLGVSSLSFERPDVERFPCLTLGYQALEAGNAMPAVLNAANEEAVAAFLDGKLGFRRIADVVAATMGRGGWQPAETLEAVLETDARARDFARWEISKRKKV